MVSLQDVLPLLAVIGLVAVATAAGVAWRLLDGRARRGSGTVVAPRDLELSRDAFGERATLLQFSTETCSRCPAARRVLAEAAEAREGVRHLEVDLTFRGDLASRFGVLTTPTTFVLDRRGRLMVRIAGVPRTAALAAALDPHPPTEGLA